MLVSDYMSKSPVTVVQSADYDRAFEIMEKQNLHHLPVVNKKGNVLGIVTRRDLQLAARHFHEAPAEICEVMHAPVVTITADASLATAAERMTQYRIGGLPVLDENKRIVGVITETDIFRAFMKLVSDQDGKRKKGGKAKKKGSKATGRELSAGAVSDGFTATQRLLPMMQCSRFIACGAAA